jgi:hypothetical protein
MDFYSIMIHSLDKNYFPDIINYDMDAGKPHKENLRFY